MVIIRTMTRAYSARLDLALESGRERIAEALRAATVAIFDHHVARSVEVDGEGALRTHRENPHCDELAMRHLHREGRGEVLVAEPLDGRHVDRLLRGDVGSHAGYTPLGDEFFQASRRPNVLAVHRHTNAVYIAARMRFSSVS